ncbi:MAG: hypothetical protein NC489_44655 [Ruminococcus flavefaciens]|nr:hypothetical protein [Ruminococcus flavefaciens]
MRTLQLIHIINDKQLEQQMDDLEERCKNLPDSNISLASLMQAAITNYPMKKYMEVLIACADEMLFDLEQAEKQKHLFDLFRKKNS